MSVFRMSKKEAADLVKKGFISKETYDAIPDDASGWSSLESQQKKYKHPPKNVNSREESQPQKRAKYRNTKIYVYENGLASQDKTLIGNGEIRFTFDSIKEYERWRILKTLEEIGEISSLERQKKFILQEKYVIDGRKVAPIIYVADFYYYNHKLEKFVIEDVKPFDNKTKKYRFTKDFNIKRKLLEYKFCSNGNCIFMLW